MSVNPIASMVGALVGPKLANSFGRRTSLIVAYWIVISGWIVLATSLNPYLLLSGIFCQQG